ncbi:MAG: S-layer homology domain-containing protein [Candidatus Gracilibacteria bacterium]
MNKKFYIAMSTVAVLGVVVIAVVAQGAYFKGSFWGWKQSSRSFSSAPVSGVKPLSTAGVGVNDAITRGQLAVLLVDAIDPNFGATYVGSTTCFKDIVDTPVAPAICYLTSKGVFAGFSNGTFKPTNSVTRAEAAKVFSFMFLNNAPAKNDPQQYKDVTQNAWYYSCVNADAVAKILDIKGGNIANFMPLSSLSVGRAKYWVENAKKNVPSNLWLK